jgi:hypothetical protein
MEIPSAGSIHFSFILLINRLQSRCYIWLTIIKTDLNHFFVIFVPSWPINNEFLQISEI